LRAELRVDHAPDLSAATVAVAEGAAGIGDLIDGAVGGGDVADLAGVRCDRLARVRRVDSGLTLDVTWQRDLIE
jgi:hypothetical protein